MTNRCLRAEYYNSHYYETTLWFEYNNVNTFDMRILCVLDQIMKTKIRPQSHDGNSLSNRISCGLGNLGTETENEALCGRHHIEPSG